MFLQQDTGSGFTTICMLIYGNRNIGAKKTTEQKHCLLVGDWCNCLHHIRACPHTFKKVEINEEERKLEKKKKAGINRFLPIAVIDTMRL